MAKLNGILVLCIWKMLLTRTSFQMCTCSVDMALPIQGKKLLYVGYVGDLTWMICKWSTPPHHTCKQIFRDLVPKRMLALFLLHCVVTVWNLDSGILQLVHGRNRHAFQTHTNFLFFLSTHTVQYHFLLFLSTVTIASSLTIGCSCLLTSQ